MVDQSSGHGSEEMERNWKVQEQRSRPKEPKLSVVGGDSMFISRPLIFIIVNNS